MKPIRFAHNKLDLAWEVFYDICAEEDLDYVSLMKIIAVNEIWICFSPPIDILRKEVLKIHGVI